MDDLWLKLNCYIMEVSMVNYTVKIDLSSTLILNYFMPYDDSTLFTPSLY